MNETPATPVAGSESRPTIRAVPYEDTLPAERPVAIRSVSLPAPSDAPPDLNGRSLSASEASPGPDNRPASSREPPKDNGNEGLAPPVSEGQSFFRRERRGSKAASIRSIPSILINDSPSRPPSRPGSRPGSRWSERKWNGMRKRSGEFERKMSSEEAPPVPQIDSTFSGISTDIPTGSLDGLAQGMKFSTRGSLIRERSKTPLKQVDQQSVDQSDQSSIQQSIQLDRGSTPEISPSPSQGDGINDMLNAKSRPSQSNGSRRSRPKILSSRAISSDEDMLSRRVRLMYERGDDKVTDADLAKSISGHSDILEENSVSDVETASTPGPDMVQNQGSNERASAEVERSRLKRETEELAGGIEYWQNVGAGQVDRYGFIHAASPDSPGGSEPHPIQRVTTSLLLASETPRRRRSIRPPAALASNRSFSARSPTRKMSSSSTAGRPSSSASTNSAPMRRTGSRLRSATNHLPHNKDRKVTDEAADMLTLPIEQESTEGKDTPAARAARKKEWEREDKWTKMAKPIKKNRDGGGMKFEFDTRSSKLIERTWKGIPDRWRSTAWYSFLEVSASHHQDSPSEDDLIDAFHELQYMSSPDDMQIDIDVPRTINSHIMFRRRYRGGQRLLFRVLHAMSLYFPDTGYVQGMAALTATLLAYYDEEHTFVMLARLWKLRGLEELYKSGFAGLMEALDDFEREWLAGGEVASKLVRDPDLEELMR